MKIAKYTALTIVRLLHQASAGAVWLVNSSRGSDISSGMAYFANNNPSGSGNRPNDYIDIGPHGQNVQWEGHTTTGYFPSSKTTFKAKIANGPLSSGPGNIWGTAVQYSSGGKKYFTCIAPADAGNGHPGYREIYTVDGYSVHGIYRCDAAACPAVDIGFDPNAVQGAGKDLSSHSWEYGTAAEGLLELYNPDLAVFSTKAFPNGRIPNASPSISSLAFAKPHISTSGNTLVNGDGAAGDPASLGVSAILLGGAYSDAATRQKDHLLNDVPRFANGAISQRESNREAWADFLYMAPPFLAYTAVRDNDLNLLRQAVQQCGYYHDILQNSNSYYKHIIPGPTGNKDTGIWSTGNGWAAMGMARVLATIQHWSGSANSLGQEQDQLVSWIKQIIDGARSAGRESSSGLLRNYLNDGSWFGETSGTALLAATVYRMAVLAPGTFNGGYIQWADDSRKAIASHVNNGILQPAVNPLNWQDRNQYYRGSPEGQSFGSMLYSAWRDCKCVGKC